MGTKVTRMIKNTIKTNEIDMDVCFFQKNITYKKHVCPYCLAFFLSLLVCKFKPYRQTWYQNFMGTYPPLAPVRIVN